MADITTKDGRTIGLLLNDETEKDFLELVELIAAFTPTIYDDVVIAAIRVARKMLLPLKGDPEFKEYRDIFDRLEEARKKRQEKEEKEWKKAVHP